MLVLVINCGSSSLKYQLLNMENENLLASGIVERIGEEKGSFTHKKYTNGTSESFEEERPFKTHNEAFKTMLAAMTDEKTGSIKSVDEISAIGHRVVQGGELFKKSSLVGEKEKEMIRSLFSMAPLHNPAHLEGIEVAQELCPHAPSVAVFDTEFHGTMPPEAYRYALPKKFYTDYGIRRYGAHGTSHRYVSREAANFLKRPLEGMNIITCHLGNGCSLTAVKDGKSIDTTMGFTPLAGTIMGTRTGDMDPAVPIFMVKQGLSAEEVDTIMNKQSGLKALCGMNDLRDIHSAVEKGDKDAEMALKTFCYSIRRQLGALWACLGNVDAIVFTAGIGENDAVVRSMVLDGLACWGVELDAETNNKRSRDIRLISAASSRIPVLVVPTNEELEIAHITQSLVQASAK